ncbi:MAG: cobalamin-dependent protein [Candidatus Altiarchaeota archaeon]
MFAYGRYAVNLSNPRHHVWMKLRAILAKEKPDLVGVSVQANTSASAAMAATIVKECAPGAVLVAGGPEATIRLSDMLDGFDFVVRGEGENTMAELADSMVAGTGFDRINGLSYLDDGVPINNLPRELAADIDAFPFPTRDLILEGEHYLPEDMGKILSSRGCPFRCRYCATGIVWAGSHR